jgi:hypothetical protein
VASWRTGVAVAVLAVEMTTHLVNFGFGESRIRVLDSASGWSYPHHLSTLAYVAGTAVCFVAARSAEEKRPAWRLAGGLFAFLLVDHVTRLHQSIAAWPLVYAPVLIALALAIAAVAVRSELVPFVYAGLGLLCASVVCHALGTGFTSLVGWTSEGWDYQVKVALKEGLELAGWVLVLPALAALGVSRVALLRVARLGIGGSR